MKVTYSEMQERLKWNLNQKIDHSLATIEKALSFSDGNAYVSFSGGKDSTVLLYLARMIKKDIKGVFFNTTNEFPEIYEFVKNTENVLKINPEVNLKWVIENKGFPLISKEQAWYIWQARHTQSEKLFFIKLVGKNGFGKISKKWRFLLDVDFEVSPFCCDWLKKHPAQLYEKQNKLLPIIGTNVGESRIRIKKYMNSGCNSFEQKHPVSQPLSIWTEDNIWEFIKKEKIPYCNLYDQGYSRLGCAVCGFGCQHDDRFERLKISHPRMYEFGMNLTNNGVRYYDAIQMILNAK